MVTKAGVPSNKALVGVASYGRLFRITEEGCTGPECKYVGRDSSDKEEVYTMEAGYLANVKVKNIVDEGGDMQDLWDGESASNITVYDELGWVEYMNESTKDARRKLYQDINFAGTADWGMDLS